ncbi:YgcG family protein [Leptospira congkakensis]|uniref:YgcG family protein n=1 Tax=Leptospira congkakensis TaxID=2484932 RepID=A0A4Z1AAT6_9LEPT|nr:YgcG family protein [Leptospira congkakensis]TGL88697.1 YgcG family protein [Leptospira congkakensis]TGL89283.1 YgcG family protein [Leptospira congkakensis]TGL97251.1 YgcG family protein [Leptospira congkakensis]
MNTHQKMINSKLKSILSSTNKWFFVFLLISTFTGIQSFPVPKLERRVMDHAGILSEATKNQLEASLKQFEAETSNQIAVYTTPSLHDEVIEDVAIQIFDEWKLGQKSKNNGILLLIAPNERKLRIEVGRGLEGALTDIQAKQIIRNEITPSFKTKDMDGGVTAGVNAIMAAIRGEYAPSEDDVDTTGNDDLDEASTGIIGGFATFFSLFVAGFGGLVVTIIGILFLYPLLVTMFGSVFALVVAIILFFLVIFLKKIFGLGKGGGGSGGYYDGGGWSSSDSWSSSSSDSWSGGGGDSGGGGSSGDW